MQRKPLSLDEALAATRQSSRLAFAPNPEAGQDWQNLIRDIVAIANTTGGVVLVGVDHKGKPIRTQESTLNAQDLSSRMQAFTGTDFQDFRIQQTHNNSTAIIIGHSPTPLVEKETGVVYMRRGGKTKPAETKDLQRATEKLLKQMRRELISLVREITSAAQRGTTLEIHHIEQTASGATVRVTHDPDAPQIRISNPDTFWPYRQKEVVELVNQALPANKQVRPYEIMCVRKVHNTDQLEEFTLKQSHASNKYSDQFVKWLIEQYRKDKDFFDRACRIMRAG